MYNGYTWEAPPVCCWWFSSPESDESPEPADGTTTLEDVARVEQEFVRQRLREELKREPTEEELSEWLREHTESY